jgi:AhpD family alkylhydroperoxidase
MSHPRSAPRIAPGDRHSAGLFAWGFAQLAGLVTRSEAPKLFLTMGRSPKLFRGWLRFAGRLMPGGRLPRRETELVILRVAGVRGCDYEFEHHVRLGRRAGVTADDVERVRVGSTADGWRDHERLLLRVTEELLATRDLADPTWTELRAAYDERRVIELLLLVGHYDMLATTLMTLRLEPDPPR